jgi:hypothetical protein
MNSRSPGCQATQHSELMAPSKQPHHQGCLHDLLGVGLVFSSAGGCRYYGPAAKVQLHKQVGMDAWSWRRSSSMPWHHDDVCMSCLKSLNSTAVFVHSLLQSACDQGNVHCTAAALDDPCRFCTICMAHAYAGWTPSKSACFAPLGRPSVRHKAGSNLGIKSNALKCGTAHLLGCMQAWPSDTPAVLC